MSRRARSVSGPVTGARHRGKCFSAVPAHGERPTQGPTIRRLRRSGTVSTRVSVPSLVRGFVRGIRDTLAGTPRRHCIPIAKARFPKVAGASCSRCDARSHPFSSAIVPGISRTRRASWKLPPLYWTPHPAIRQRGPRWCTGFSRPLRCWKMRKSPTRGLLGTRASCPHAGRFSRTHLFAARVNGYCPFDSAAGLLIVIVSAQSAIAFAA